MKRSSVIVVAVLAAALIALPPVYDVPEYTHCYFTSPCLMPPHWGSPTFTFLGYGGVYVGGKYGISIDYSFIQIWP